MSVLLSAVPHHLKRLLWWSWDVVLEVQMLRYGIYWLPGRACVCMMGFGPGQRLLMRLMLERERQREREMHCSTIGKTELDVSTTSCFSQHLNIHVHTHTPHAPTHWEQRGRGSLWHSLSPSLCSPIYIVTSVKTEGKWNLRPNGLMQIQSASGLTSGTKVLIASHRPVAAEFDLQPAVGGSSQLCNTCPSLQNESRSVFWGCSVRKSNPLPEMETLLKLSLWLMKTKRVDPWLSLWSISVAVVHIKGLQTAHTDFLCFPVICQSRHSLFSCCKAVACNT